MRIVLMRHGKPNLAPSISLAAKDFHQWIDAYNRAGLCKLSDPSAAAIEISSHCKTIVCSDLPRSIESAQRLGFTVPNIIDNSFREMEMPYSSFLAIKCSPTVWSVIFRMLWFLGFSKNSESFVDAKSRAICAANALEKLARENDSVLFVGHGFLNKYIAKQLYLNGWVCLNGWGGPANPGNNYWSFGVFEYKVNSLLKYKVK